jgi:hypothetical protein
MSDWGKGVINDIGWGQGANNDIGWGSIYDKSNAGETLLSGGGFDSDYQAVLDKGIANGNTAPTSTTAGNQLMIDLKDSGAFAKADALGVLASGVGSDSGFALIDWKRLINLTAVNSPAFNNIQGFSGNGTSSYIDLAYNPSTDAVNWGINDHSFMAFNSNSTAQRGALISCFDLGNVFCEILNDDPGNRFIVYDNSPIGRVPAIPSGEQDGMLEVKRISSTTFKLYKDGTEISIGGSVETDSTPNMGFGLFARSYGSSYGNGQSPFFYIGQALTDTERLDLLTAVNTYLASI